jgi:hypothetical protein
MRVTYSQALNAFLDGTGNTGSTDTNLISFFKRQLNRRYQLCLTVLMGYQTQKPLDFQTVATQQYYHNPPGIMRINAVTVTVGGITYSLDKVESQQNWDRLNAIPIQPLTFPSLYFPRRDDYGLWPIPQDAYDAVLNSDLRDRNLTNTDYVTGTISISNNSRNIVGTGTTFTANMVGMWFSATDDGYWYRISGFTDTTHLTLESAYIGISITDGNYTIGESFEMPEELHDLPHVGAIADYYSMVRRNKDDATWWNNVFWTGDGNNNKRWGEAPYFEGGLLGGKNRYLDRTESALVNRRPRMVDVDSSWIEDITE